MQRTKAGLHLLYIVAFATIGFVTVSPAAASSFLDNTLGDIKPEDRIVIANPKPIQLLFEFQNNGTLNAKAQNFLRERIVADVKAGGLFSDVSDAPTPDGAVLSVVLNNVADLKRAESDGVKTGLTLGLAASTVTDGYVCSITYLGGGVSTVKVTKTTQQFIYTTVGLFGSDPPNATKMKSLDEAIYAMTDQVLAHTLNDLATDPTFNPNAPSPKPASAAGASPPTTTDSTSPRKSP
jgi:hypothetical protein